MQTALTGNSPARLGRILLWLIVISSALVVIASIATPNLLRSRSVATGASRAAQRAVQEPRALAAMNGMKRAQTVDAAAGGNESLVPLADDVRKIVQTACLAISVKDVSQAFQQVTAAARAAGGYVESSNLARDGSEVRSATARIRVPAERLDALRAQLRGFAVTVDNEQTSAAEVTAEYVDLAASLRNFRAEEQQYLAIMQRSGSIKDTLEVARSLADVRGRIERTQGRLNLIDHQVAMATLDVSLRAETLPLPPSPRWQPLAHARVALQDALANFANWVDFMIAALLQLPVVLLWLLTVLVSAAAAWKILRFAWRCFFAPPPAGPSPVPAS